MRASGTQFGGAVRRLRHRSQLSQRQLGDELRLTPDTISKIERGARPMKEADLWRLAERSGGDVLSLLVPVLRSLGYPRAAGLLEGLGALGARQSPVGAPTTADVWSHQFLATWQKTPTDAAALVAALGELGAPGADEPRDG